ncbi:acetyl-CoA carboxylase biotin carboxyl carrier protein subunit [bacterium]|nr:acetyl-CoA carboxylase biotin carboxyl carrier protein subunit [bacterium]
MRQNYLTEGESREVIWEKLQAPLVLQLGEEHVEVVHHRPGFCLLADGRCLRYSAVYQSSQHEWTLQWQGQPYVVKVLRSNRSGGAGGAQDGCVKSPMNGVVVKIQAKIGDLVEAGQVILVLEAMKMENEVAAPLAGQISRLEVSPGQVVGAQQLLFEIQPSKE